MTRQLRRPRWSEIRPMIGIDPPRLTAAAKLERALTIGDLRDLARRSVPRSVFDYVDGGAGREIAMHRAQEAFDRVELIPGLLGGHPRVDKRTTILGKPSRLPLVLAPTGFTRLAHVEGEVAVARAAAAAGIPYSLSTLSTSSIEQVAAVRGDAPQWFQLYVLEDRGLTKEFVSRAAAAQYDALVVTVDTAVGGDRLKDVRNGFSIPPRITPRTMMGMARHPSWVARLLTSEPLNLASFPDTDPEDMWRRMKTLTDPTFSFEEIAWLRDEWSGPLVVKGLLTVEGARRAADLGADAVVLSSHGGRQLDRAPVPLEILPDVVEAVGDRVEVMIDSGVRSGADVAAAVALGARACLVGRPYLYGLMAAGQAGVEHAIAIYSANLGRTMKLLGVAGTDELGPQHARLR
jgi:L-lactate dehydrogenase (cytochrome)